MGKALEKYMEKGIEFAIQNAPELVRQYLLKETWLAIIGIVIGSVFFLVGCSVIYVLCKKDDDDGFIRLMAFLFTGISLLVVVVNTYNLILIKAVPYVYLLESLKNKH